MEEEDTQIFLSDTIKARSVNPASEAVTKPPTSSQGLVLWAEMFGVGDIF
jgi:hypothetical protein